jgi:hypothetical protein
LTDSAWPRRPATFNQRGSLWRQCRNQLSQSSWPSGTYLDYATAISLDNETRPKFFALQNVFWIQLTDFLHVVAQHPHLQDVKLSTRAMIMHDFPFGKGTSEGHPGGLTPAVCCVETEKEASVQDTSMVNGID